ncbi:MFS transporter [Actinocorallia sp. B10E7]|uniref:MFS transporter n=1 Tax=Actinocorallia sp. B10E7 TaxID=3153558 RepID=UPI00325E2C64
MGSFGAGRAVVPLLAFLGVVAYSLPMAVMSPALPDLQTEMGTSAAGAAWSVTGMVLSASVATPVAGRLGDLLGARRVLVWVLGVGIAGQVVSAVAATLPVLLAGRVLAGVGSGVFPLAYTIIRKAYPPERTSSAVGLMSSMLGLGGVLSWVIAGPVIDHLGWRWLIWVPAVILLPGTFLARRALPPVAGEPGRRVDWWGAALFGGWLTAGLTALTQGSVWGWTSGPVLGLLAGAAVGAAAWALIEAKVPDPLLDLRLMRLRGVWTANLGSLLAGYCLMAAGLLFPLLIQLPERDGFGFGGTATDTAVVALPASVAMTFMGLVNGRLDRRFGGRAVLAAGALLTAAGYGTLIFWHTELWQLMVTNVLRGAGLGMAYAAVATLVVTAVPVSQTGVASGVNTLLRTVGAGLGTQLTAILVAAYSLTRTGFVLAFTVCTVLALGVLAVALLVPRRPEPAGPAADPADEGPVTAL